MREIALFVEDFAHRQIIGALVRRLAEERGVDARLDWRSAVRGHGRVVQELGDYLRDLGRQGGGRSVRMKENRDSFAHGGGGSWNGKPGVAVQ